MVIAHNLLAVNSNIQFNRNVRKKTKSTEKLSAGFQVNRAADDAAGLSISEKMRNQIRNLNKALDNIDDGISFVHTADGALDEVQKMLHRIEELSVQAANDVYDQDDRKAINNEVQELKDEIHDIFRDTSFNGKKIFRVSYVPEIKSRPMDFQVFNTADGEYGGILVNNLRYSWDELEKKVKNISDNQSTVQTKLFKDDGKTFVGGRYTFYDYTGEKITFDTKANTQAPDISRLYEWKAKDDGIYINDVLATTWTDLGIIPGSDIKEHYSFTFHGMEVSFNTEIGDNSLKDIMDGINSVDFNSMVTWSGVTAGIYNSSAAELTTYNNNYIVVEDAWKNHTTNMKIVANDTGVSLVNIGKNAQNQDVEYVFSTMSWKDFKNINSSLDLYPIVDWGNGIDSMDRSSITLNHDAVYKFKDQKTGFYFDFKLSDEASLDEVKKGLSVDLGESYYAPVELMQTSNTNTNFRVSGFNMPSVDYITQLKTNKSFDNWQNNAFNTKFYATYNSQKNTCDISFDLLDTNGAVVARRMTSISWDTFGNNVLNGRSQRISLTLDNAGDGGLSTISFDFATNRFAMTPDQLREAKTEANEAKRLCEIELQYEEKAAYLMEGKPEDQFDTYWQTKKTETGIIQKMESAYSAKYLEYEIKYKNEYINNAVSYLSGTNLKLTNLVQPKVRLSMAFQNNISQHTEFGTIVNLPERYMYVQSGANAGEDTKIIWTGLNLSAISMGDADTSTREQAINTITATYRATQIVSGVRSKFGAYENRLIAEYKCNEYYKQNLESSESAVRDTDMAAEIMSHAKLSILENLSQTMIAQSNKNAQSVLNLLEG